MNEHTANLGRAARLLKRVADIGGPNEFEGVAIKEIVADVLEAQNRAFMEATIDRFSRRVDDADVVDLHDFAVRRNGVGSPIANPVNGEPA